MAMTCAPTARRDELTKADTRSLSSFTGESEHTQ